MAYNKFKVASGFDFQDFIEVSTVWAKGGYTLNRPRIFCADGFNFSVQASSVHYCSPRYDGMPYYDEYEIGFPSHGDSLIAEYAENSRKCRKTVYGYIPAAVIKKLIAKHGGIKYYAIHEG
jgi:hypothetical protein